MILNDDYREEPSISDTGREVKLSWSDFRVFLTFKEAERLAEGIRVILQEKGL